MSARLADSTCPVARAVDIVGDKWSLLIIRDAFDGIRRFSQFQRDLGIAKNILAARLRDLVDAGVLRIEPAPGGGAYQEYVLTEKGEDLFDLVVSLRQWGQDHAFAPGERHSVLVEEETGRPLPRLSYTTPDGHHVQARQTRVRKASESASLPGPASRAPGRHHDGLRAATLRDQQRRRCSERAGKAPLPWLRAGRSAGDVPAGPPRETRTSRAHATTGY
jgi:DNA-binding HxlR family transcriptional regulator